VHQAKADNKKYYLIEATFGEDTRLANSPERFGQLLRTHCETFFQTWTNGSVPAVQVKEVAPARPEQFHNWAFTGLG